MRVRKTRVADSSGYSHPKEKAKTMAINAAVAIQMIALSIWLSL